MADELSSVQDYRDWLAHNLYGWLQWRSANARDHPHDRRNLRVVEVLLAATYEVEALPDDDPKLGLIVCLRKAGDEAVERFLDEEHYLLARHGFAFDGTQTTGELLRALVKAADDAVLASTWRFAGVAVADVAQPSRALNSSTVLQSDQISARCPVESRGLMVPRRRGYRFTHTVAGLSPSP